MQIDRPDERDECGLAKDIREAWDAMLANDYAEGRRHGIEGLSPAGRPEHPERAQEYLNGYRSGLAVRLLEVQKREVRVA